MRWTEALSAANIAAYYRTSNTTTAFPGETLFPARKKMGLDLKYLESIGSGVRVLKRAAFDTLPPKRERQGASMQSFEMPFFREQMALKEVDRQELLKIGEGNNALFNEAIRYIYDDRMDLVMGARAQMERMRMLALFTGGISITDSEGLDVDIDYGFDAATQRTPLVGTSQWTDYANAKPIEDLRAAKKAANIAGTAIAYMTEKTFADLAMCESVKDSLFYNVPDGSLVADNEVRSRLETRFGVRIIVIDGTVENYWYIDEHGVQTPYVPDNAVAIVPAGTLGNTWFGTTPEEADLLGGVSDARVEIVETGVAITSLVTPGPPVQVMTTASMICLPTLPNIKKMHIIQTA